MRIWLILAVVNLVFGGANLGVGLIKGDLGSFAVGLFELVITISILVLAIREART